jgi:hypothetical protein
MRSLSKQYRFDMAHGRGYALKQRGVVLFFALIALVVMSLAAVALIRSKAPSPRWQQPRQRRKPQTKTY